MTNLAEHKFKSARERQIADFLQRYHLPFVYEHPVAVTSSGKTRLWYPDFYLPNLGVYIEYYGLAGIPDYDGGIKKKTEGYTKNHAEVIPLFPDDFRHDWQGHLLRRFAETQRYRMRVAERAYRSRPPTAPRYRSRPGYGR